MKRLYKYSAVIFLVLLLFITFFPITAFAEGEDGGTGGIGNYSGNVSSNPIETLLVFALIGITTSGGTILLIFNIKRAHISSKKLIKKYEKLGINWDNKEMQKQVEKAYFEIQESRRRMHADYAADYLSDNMLEEFTTKLRWMKYRKEKVVMEDIELIKAFPVSAYNDNGEENDVIWYFIYGSMIDYILDVETYTVKSGHQYSKSFCEYWMFVRKNGRWVLNKICQKNAFNIHKLPKN